MKKLILLVFLFVVVACKQAPNKSEPQVTLKKETIVEEVSDYPKSMQQLLNAHGGLSTWKAKRTLQYTMPKGEYKEVHTIDLYSRKDKVVADAFSMGYDGKATWLLDEHAVYEGNPDFYHNLFFYFFAMPFVLADDGVVYTQTDDLVFEGKAYPGIRISYNAGVGTSPEDEYYVHYDPNTHKMVWLGYTVTYKTKEKSQDIRWIRYNDWETVGELLLPKSITWYNYEGRTIKNARSTMNFENISLTGNAIDAQFYAKPENAMYYHK